MLPADVARCPGRAFPSLSLDAGCSGCRRFTEWASGREFLTQPPTETPCPLRIGPVIGAPMLTDLLPLSDAAGAICREHYTAGPGGRIGSGCGGCPLQQQCHQPAQPLTRETLNRHTQRINEAAQAAQEGAND